MKELVLKENGKVITVIKIDDITIEAKFGTGVDRFNGKVSPSGLSLYDIKCLGEVHIKASKGCSIDTYVDTIEVDSTGAAIAEAVLIPRRKKRKSKGKNA